MGLSGRRRAKKENRLSANKTPADAEDLQQTHQSDHQHHRNDKKRTGNTQRRVAYKLARERKRTNLLAFDVNRGWSHDLMPAKPATHPDIKEPVNANVYNRKMLRVMENDYTSDVNYSLNKRHRWDFAKQLEAQYAAKDELKSQNLFIAEAVARGQKAAIVRKVTTNARYTVEAAKELRDHKKTLQKRSKLQAKEAVLNQDRFKFSEAVTQAQNERPLTSFGATKRRQKAVNTKSLKYECNLWNNLYNVSPSAEEVRMEMQRDYEGRVTVSVGTCVPCPTSCGNKFIQTEKDTFAETFNSKIRPKLWQRIIREKHRYELELQYDMDGWCSDCEFEEEPSDARVSCEETPARSTCEAATLFDMMRPKISVNREKKLVEKERKMKRKAKEEEQQKKKQRKNSGQTFTSVGGSSGYDSGCEASDEKETVGEVAVATETVDVRLMEAIEMALTAERPTVRVASELADAERVVERFLQADCRPALVVSASTPRKLAVLIRPDISEAVVLEEMDDEKAKAEKMAAFAVHHVCARETALTSAGEVAAQADPFEFLCRLATTEPDTELESTPTKAANAVASFPTPGWKRANALSESHARLTAVQSLPMFAASEEEQQLDGAEVVVVPGTECEICCQQLPINYPTAGNSFVDGATMLTECGHRFCNGCWLQHVASNVAAGRPKVACPGFRCGAGLDAATLLWFCPSGLVSALAAAAFRVWLSDRSQDRLRRRLCAQANCGRVLEAPDRLNAVCAACRHGMCLGCGQEPHWPSDCATAAKYRARMESLGHTKLALNDLTAKTDVNAKQCPTCFLLMEKGFGCNHMSCPCGEHFCWWCGKPLRLHTGGPCGSFRNRNTTKSEYRVQREFTAEDSFLVPNSVQSRFYCNAVRTRLHRQWGKASILCGKARTRLADLFASYAIRFQSVSWQEAVRKGSTAADRLLQATVQASYLVEFSYAHMDIHRSDRGTSTAVCALGSHISQLVETITAEVKEQSRRGYRGPKQTRTVCERLWMQEICLRSKCRLLHSIVVQHRDRANGEQTPGGDPLAKRAPIYRL